MNNSLQELLADTSLYTKSSQNSALFSKLFELTQCNSLQIAKQRNLFPLISELRQLEADKYAEIVTQEIEQTMTDNIQQPIVNTNSFELIDENFIVNPQPIKEIKSKKERVPISTIWKQSMSDSLKATLSKAIEPSTDFIKKHVLSYTTNPEIIEQKRMEKQKLLDTVPDVLVCKDRRNEVEKQKQEKIKSFMTADGFEYYKAKQPLEFIQHPNKPHPARCDDLQQPYDEFEIKSDLKQKIDDTRPEFNQFTDTHSRLFGMKGNEQFYQSVFCANEDEQILFERQRKEKALQEWKDKMVVEDKLFRVDLRSKCDKVSIVDRYKNILQDEAMKPSLKYNNIKGNECISQTAQWEFNENELENRKTITRTELDPSKFLNGEFEHVHITKPDALHLQKDNLSTRVNDAFSKVTDVERTSKSKLYGMTSKGVPT